MIRSIVSTAVAGLAGFAATKAVLRSRLRTHDSVVRTNHAGHDVSLAEGPAVAAGLVAGSLLIEDPRQRSATLLATAAAGSLGAVDDFCESGTSRDCAVIFRPWPAGDHDRGHQGHRHSARIDRGRSDPAQPHPPDWDLRDQP